MKLYKESVKAEALAILEGPAKGNLSETERQTGIPDSTLSQWRDEQRTSLLTPEQRQLAKKKVAERVETVRSLYLERASEPDAVAKTSGFYAVLAVKNLTEVHQLLTGGPTARIEGSLAAFLSRGDPTPEDTQT